MKANIIFSSVDAIETIKAAGCVMAFKNNDLSAKMGETYARSKTRHASTNNYVVKMFTCDFQQVMD